MVGGDAATGPMALGGIRTVQLVDSLVLVPDVLSLPREPRNLRGHPTGLFTDTVPFVRVDRHGVLRDTIALVETPQRELWDAGPMWGLDPDIFGDQMRAVLRGDWLVVVSGREIRRYLASAPDTARVHEWEAVPTITPELITAERERRMDEASALRVAVDGIRPGDMRRDVIRDLPVADPVPAFDDLAGAHDGGVWVRTLTMPTDTVAEWFLVDIDGRQRGRLRLPADERIESGSAEWVVVRSVGSGKSGTTFPVILAPGSWSVWGEGFSFFLWWRVR
jgi:hypothetical protein